LIAWSSSVFDFGRTSLHSSHVAREANYFVEKTQKELTGLLETFS